MKKLILMVLLSTSLSAQFNFCSSENSESKNGGSFSDFIPESGYKTIGTIPKGVENLKIYLNSKTDVDVQLIDTDNSVKIIYWGYTEKGLLSGATKESTNYQNMKVTYSGYNGTNGNKGNEYILIDGKTTVNLKMTAFGYESGNADVSYSFESFDGCSISETGTGYFNEDILKDRRNYIGSIPKGVDSLKVSLFSKNDIDIQLIDTDNSIKIVAWAKYYNEQGILNGATKESTNYRDMKVTYSGYNGTYGNKGNEYILIDGKTTVNLDMYAYGYNQGNADVHYSWGDTSIEEEYYLDLPFKKSFRVTQGNNASYSHKKYSNWDNIYAIDFAIPLNTKILAPADGEIVCLFDEDHTGGEFCKDQKGCLAGGRVLVMQDTKGNLLTFLHLNSFNVEVGNKVKRGDVIALSGKSGGDWETGSCNSNSSIHLHFHLWDKSKGVLPDSFTKPFDENSKLKVKIDGVEKLLYGNDLDDDKIVDKNFESLQ
jgi:hypothetical protein